MRIISFDYIVEFEDIFKFIDSREQKIILKIKEIGEEPVEVFRGFPYELDYEWVTRENQKLYNECKNKKIFRMYAVCENGESYIEITV